MKNAIRLLLIATVFSGCCGQKLLQRYAKLDRIPPKNDTVTNGPEVYVSARDVPVPPTPNPFVLTDHGQAAYIAALSAKTNNLTDFQSNLFPDLSDYVKTPSSIDDRVFTKRLLLTVLNHTPFEADRITKVSIRIFLNTNVSNLKIETFDKITTQYQTVDLGTVNQADALSGTASASYGLTGPSTSVAGGSTSTTTNNPDGSVVTTTPVTTTGTATGPAYGIGVSGTASRTTTSQVDYQSRFIALTGYFKNDSLVFDEESQIGLNLTGNIVSDIKFKFTDKGTSKTMTYSVGNLTTDATINPRDKVKIKAVPVYESSLPDKLELPVSYEITVRHVINDKGRMTVPESDDEIAYYTVAGTTKANMVLVTRDDLTVKKWLIGKGNVTLKINDTILGTSGTMLFTSYDNCASFLRWLRKTPLIVGGIKCGDYEFVTSDGSSLASLIAAAQVSQL